VTGAGGAKQVGSWQVQVCSKTPMMVAGSRTGLCGVEKLNEKFRRQMQNQVNLVFI
jgi:hypothetical protein